MDSPTHEEIAARAYEIFNKQGQSHGQAEDHWFQAEKELRERRGGMQGFEGGNGSSNGSGSNARSSSGGLAQPVTGEAAMNEAKRLNGGGDASARKSKNGGKAAKRG